MPGQTKVIETIQEDLEEAESDTDCGSHPGIIKEIRLRRSYAAFCEEFTLSGSQHPARRVQVSLAVEGLKDEEQFLGAQSVNCPAGTGKDLGRPPVIAIQPGNEEPRGQTPTSSREDLMTLKSRPTGNTHPETSSSNLRTNEMAADMQNIEPLMSSTSYLRPPTQVLTPSIYHEMQRTRQAHKQAQRWKFLGTALVAILKKPTAIKTQGSSDLSQKRPSVEL